jgi:predicted nucleotidyltransferase
MDFKEIAERNKILEIRVGSHLFGTDTPDSDLDLVGIFMPSEEMVFGGERCEEVDLGFKAKDDTGRNTAQAIDFKMHEYRKFVKLALQNNPNILHMLFINDENIRFIDGPDGFGQRLLSRAHLFPHKGAHHRFVKYADSQRHKMRIKPQMYAALEDGLRVLSMFDDNHVLADVVINQSLANAAPFVDSGQGKHVQCGDLHFERGVFVKKAKKMIRDRLSRATNRAQLFTKHGYDTKFASNLIQLLMEGIELMVTGRISFPLAFRDDILAIKRGDYSADYIMEWADNLVELARASYEKTSLPSGPRTNEIQRFVIEEVKRFTIGSRT